MVEPIKGGWHAKPRELSLAVRGSTREEARELFELALRKSAELRARPDPFSLDVDTRPLSDSQRETA